MGYYVTTSILTGMIASFFVFILFFVWRPVLIVSDHMAYDKNSNKINVKIINKTKVPIHDVTYELLKCYNRGDGIVDIISCKPAKPNMLIVNKYDKNDAEAKYAVRISYDEADNGIIDWLKLDDGHYVLFNITVKHSFSGGIKTISKKIFA